jgi:cell division septation protein DedD
MRLQAFITDLLFEHDCVVVPGFGGLVANYRSARLNRSTHVVQPPSKHIGYNRNLINNDGLLVHHVAGIMGITYTQALARVEEEVANCQHLLNKEGRIVWEKIGVFFKDKSGQIHFVPEEQENFLLSSYGLGPVQLKYVAQQIPTKETPIITLDAGKRAVVGAWKIAAAAAIPLLFGGALLLRNQLNSNSDFNLASFNPFESARVLSDYTPRAADSTWQVSEFTISEPAQIIEPIAAPIEQPKNTVAAKPTKVNDSKKTKASGTATSTNIKGKYAVIGGAFKVKSNANNFVKKLQAQGFDAQIVGTKDELTLVAYGVYSTSKEADNAIQNILTDKSARAWVKHF